jgi:hypothetical protein
MNSAASVTKKPPPRVPLPPIVTKLSVQRFTIEEYHRLLAVGQIPAKQGLPEVRKF